MTHLVEASEQGARSQVAAPKKKRKTSTSDFYRAIHTVIISDVRAPLLFGDKTERGELDRCGRTEGRWGPHSRQDRG